MVGGADNDALYGGNLGDTLTGGTGVDFLDGGTGTDVYRYTAIDESTASARDTISGFAHSQDDIRLVDIGSFTFDAAAGAGVAPGEGSSAAEGGNTAVYFNSGGSIGQILIIGTVAIDSTDFIL